jgi:hypothetical protein
MTNQNPIRTKSQLPDFQLFEKGEVETIQKALIEYCKRRNLDLKRMRYNPETREFEIPEIQYIPGTKTRVEVSK